MVKTETFYKHLEEHAKAPSSRRTLLGSRPATESRLAIVPESSKSDQQRGASAVSSATPAVGSPAVPSVAVALGLILPSDFHVRADIEASGEGKVDEAIHCVARVAAQEAKA